MWVDRVGSGGAELIGIAVKLQFCSSGFADNLSGKARGQACVEIHPLCQRAWPTMLLAVGELGCTHLRFRNDFATDFLVDAASPASRPSLLKASYIVQETKASILSARASHNP